MTDPINAPLVTIIEMSDDISAIAKALPKAQTEMGDVIKNASNPAFRSRYADLGAVIEATVPALNKHGIALLQPTAYDGEFVRVSTMFLHETGQWIRCTIAIPTSKKDAHSIGSASTYGRRYSLLAMTGAAPEDDDGNASSGPRQDRREPPAATGPSPAAQYAADQLRAAKTKDEFSHFWNTQKDGLRQSLSDGDYAHVVKVMQAEAKRFSEPQNQAETPFDQKEAA